MLVLSRRKTRAPTVDPDGDAAASAVHYSQRDLPTALGLYRKLMASHAVHRRSRLHSRAQIRNIVGVIVSEQELLDAGIALAHLPPREST